MLIHVATKNPHKVEEIRLVAPSFLELRPIGVDGVVEETGESYVENSILKALEYGKMIGAPVVADDSGLSIDALDGFPGVMSARYLEGAPYDEKMRSILRLMEHVENRSARFVCSATYFDPATSFVLSVQGEVTGRIAFDIRGNRGFGYDPIFIPDGYNETFGELGDEVKKRISHRSVAFRKLFSLLQALGVIRCEDLEGCR